MVVLSDHGQCLGTPFSQRYGELLEDVARRLMHDTSTAKPLDQSAEYAASGPLILAEVGRGRGVRPWMARRASRRRKSAGTTIEGQSLVACASGNLVLLYLTCLDGRLDRDEISRRYPELIPGLVMHPGVALVVVDTTDVGPVALGRAGEHELATGRVLGEDPLAGFGPLAAQSLRRLAGFWNTGDLMVIGPYDEATGEVVSFEDLVGSHGGLGGWQMEPFLLHPVDLTLKHAPLIGATGVHDELRRWQRICPRAWLDRRRTRGNDAEHPATAARETQTRYRS